MTKTIVSIAAVLFTASATGASLYDGNDTEGTVLSGVQANMSTAVEPGIGDNYGSIFYFPTSVDAGDQQATAKGGHETYGSVLHDTTDIRW